MQSKTKMQVSGTYGKKKCRITRCMRDTCKVFETVGWRVTFPGGYSTGYNTWEMALAEALAFWKHQR